LSLCGIRLDVIDFTTFRDQGNIRNKSCRTEVEELSMADLRIGVRIIRHLCLAIVSVVPALSPAAAQGLSNRPITIVVPYTPGTGPDVIARLVGEELKKRWNQPVVVDNKPGATGNIGTQFVARAAPDGHTVLMSSNPFTSNVSLFSNLPYDPIKSFVPIIDVGAGALALCVHPSVPATNVAEFIAFVKSRQSELNYGSPGIGGPHHLAMELFKQVTQIEMKHIPYRGSAGATQDIVGGHVSGGFLSLSLAAPLARSNSLRILGIASKDRVRTSPQLPTLAEQGINGFEAELWFGLLAPAGTPYETVRLYNTTINEIVRESHIVELAAKQGIVTRGGTSEQLGEFLVRDITTWQKVVKEAGIKSE
jgi:tripartite-type tricarboxylate transporter receptor subunit TctC